MSRMDTESYPMVLRVEVPLVLTPLDEVPALPCEPAPAAGTFAALWEVCFGVITLLVGLAILAAIPLLQFLSLGYLLEVGGRVGRTGRLRDGFIGLRPAARLGSVLLGAGLMLLPLQFVSSLWMSAEFIEPGGPIARGWKTGLTLLTLLMAAHIALACARGGRLRYFFWTPGNLLWLVRRLRQGGYYRSARDGVCEFLLALRLPYYAWLGLRGFVGSFVWLAIPVTFLATGREVPPIGVLGGLLLVVIVLYLPFLQVHFVVQNRFRAMFELGVVRDLYRRAPLAFAITYLLALAFALPLYFLRIEMIPREAAWLPSLVFIFFMFPARLLTGWSYGLAVHRHGSRHWLFRWTGRPAMVVVAALYALVVYLTQFVLWNGIWSLYEQHAFLLPVPFFSM